jgi:hypothetical protein
MAGDWIKMRGELFTHPKFIALSNCLIFSDKASQPFLTYVCGEDALDIGVLPRTARLWTWTLFALR